MGRYGTEWGRPEVKNAQQRSVIFAWQARGRRFESAMLQARGRPQLSCTRCQSHLQAVQAKMGLVIHRRGIDRPGWQRIGRDKPPAAGGARCFSDKTDPNRRAGVA